MADYRVRISEGLKSAILSEVARTHSPNPSNGRSSKAHAVDGKNPVQARTSSKEVWAISDAKKSEDEGNDVQ